VRERTRRLDVATRRLGYSNLWPPAPDPRYSIAMRNVILIAAPDEERLEAMSECLETAGYRCLTAMSGAAALATAASYAPQLAILFADLPEVQGTDVCLRLKQEGATAHVAVVLIGKDSPQERFVATEVGADRYLADPVDDKTLLDAVRELFSKLVLNAR